MSEAVPTEVQESNEDSQQPAAAEKTEPADDKTDKTLTRGR